MSLKTILETEALNNKTTNIFCNELNTNSFNVDTASFINLTVDELNAGGINYPRSSAGSGFILETITPQALGFKSSPYLATISDTSFISLANNTLTPILNSNSNVTGSLLPPNLVPFNSYKLTAIYNYVSPNAGNARFDINLGGTLVGQVDFTLPVVNLGQTMKIEFYFTPISGLGTNQFSFLQSLNITYNDDSKNPFFKALSLRPTLDNSGGSGNGFSISAINSTTGLDMTLVYCSLKTEYSTTFISP